MNKLSRVLGVPFEANLKKKFISKSHKLLNELGLTYFNDGVATLMPIMMKSLRKLEKIVHYKMKEISALEVRLPKLVNSEIFKTSGRLNLPNLYSVKMGENKSYILCPTCEEIMSHLLSNRNDIVMNQLPLSYYQISTKFRHENRPKSGLLRTREFVMKDLYVFNSCAESNEESYQKVTNLYHQFFDILKVPYYWVEGNTGEFGGLISHEYHFLSSAGEDKIILCQNCGHNENLNLTEFNDATTCRKCNSSNVKVENGIEVGHTFNLGTRFTKPFNVQYMHNNEKKILHMSSFGLGLSRLLAASIEILCKPDKIIWPLAIVPYSVCLVPPKAGSKEEAAVKDLTNVLYHNLNEVLEDDIIIDDRTSLTIGRRLLLLEKVGFPLIVVIGKGVLSDVPTVEIIDSVTGSVNHIQIPDVTQFILNKIMDEDTDKILRKKVTKI